VYLMMMTAKKPADERSTEVLPHARRRTFTAKYKLRILLKADACTTPGAIGELLRKEGLYSSHLVLWRKQRERGQIAGLQPRKRGPVARTPDARDAELADLRDKVAALTARAERAEALVELQKKLASLLSTASGGRP
jgi:transposase-like protein